MATCHYHYPVMMQRQQLYVTWWVEYSAAGRSLSLWLWLWEAMSYPVTATQKRFSRSLLEERSQQQQQQQRL